MEREKNKCRAWYEGDPILEEYHDNEWCKVNHDDNFQFEMLCLEGASVGLSWKTILHKRANYRAAFHDFQIDKCSEMTDEELANNTVAIITVGSIVKKISARFGITPRKAASLLDSASCVVQCLIPYGAQTLLATSLASISPVSTLPYLYYPMALSVMIALSIIFLFPRKRNKE